MFCGQCGGKMDPADRVCRGCGAPAIHDRGPAAPQDPAGYGPSDSGRPRKSKSTYQLLGLLLGFFGFPGVHNFYAGYTGKALAQILMTVFSCWILWLPAFIWTIVEVCTVTEDADGVPFE